MSNVINISFFGAPNSGKSTLFNALVKKNIAIISDKPQTTERITNGLLYIDNIVINLYDTPGISFIKNKGLRGVLNEISWTQLNQKNYNFFLVPGNKLTIPEDFIEKVDNLIVIITKIDMIPKGKIPQLIEKINDLYQPKDILCVSGKYDKGIDCLLNYFLSLPHRDNLNPQKELEINNTIFLNPQQEITTFVKEDSQQLAIDMTREAIFNVLNKEVPYYINIENLSWKEGPKGIQLEQILWVPNVQYRIILYSKHNLEEIKKRAHQSLEQLLDKKISLRYVVKISKKK